MDDGLGIEGQVVTVLSPAPARGVVVRHARGGGRLVHDQGAPAARPWEAAGSIDVELLVRWAYRVQRVDRFLNGGLHVIEMEASGAYHSSWSTDGCAALGQIAHLGCRVDTYGAVRDVVHPAAEVVASVLDGLPAGRLVAFWAGLDGRPTGWALPERQWRAVSWVRPWVEAQAELHRGKPTHCEIIRTASAEGVADRRAEYLRWWDTLDQLAWELSMKAMGFVVLRPSAPREPWSNGGEA